MWLLNFHTLAFSEYSDAPPKYPGASHRWNERPEKTLKVIEEKFRLLCATKHTTENVHRDLKLYKYMEVPKDELTYVIFSLLPFQDPNMT